jgi:hypothetical protein
LIDAIGRRILQNQIGANMEYKRNIFAGLSAKVQAAHGNVTTLRSVPAVDRMMLDVALGKIAAIEKTLEAARDAARAAARRAGVSGSYLFEATSFIPRSSGRRWRDEGIEQGKAEMIALYTRLNAPPSPEFKALGDAVRREIARGGFKSILGKDKGAVADDPDALAEAEAEAKIMAEAKTTADAILAAARLRDAGGPPLPEPTGKAKRILDAARKAHRRQGDD